MISADINNMSGNIVESYTYDYLGNRTMERGYLVQNSEEQPNIQMTSLRD